MILFSKRKDGGPKSPVEGYFLCEFKNWFSIALLKFNEGGREQFHTHAFNAWTWFLSGDLVEEDIDGSTYEYRRSIFPKKTSREKFHRVKAKRAGWCLTIRGPWQRNWSEYDPETKKKTTFDWGRNVVATHEVTILHDPFMMITKIPVTPKTYDLGMKVTLEYQLDDQPLEQFIIETSDEEKTTSSG